MSKLTLYCLLAALFLGSALADLCLSSPGLVPPGGGCGGALPCDQFHFCNKEGVCARRVKEGEDCKDAACEANLVCKGPEDRQRCYPLTHPGQDCTSGSGPSCGTDECDSGRCIGGSIGDACYENDDCRNELTCTNRICTGLAMGAACESDSCEVGAYCNPKTNTCASLPTSGNCTSEGQCAYGFVCNYRTKKSEVRECIAVSSLPAGSFCDNEPAVCESHRCFQDYCAEESPNYCAGNDQCASDETCTCDGAELVAGLGTCKAWECKKLSKAYFDCFYANCRSETYFNGSCVQRNCDKEYTRFTVCNPASTLFVSFFSVSLFALLASFFGRHF